jgi:hypothetical protein
MPLYDPVSFASISPLTTGGDLLYENATPAPVRLPVGSAGQALGVSGGVPAWLQALELQAATPVGGFALVNGTPNILSWTAPGDGKQHRVIVMGGISVSSAETGGLVNVSLPLPNTADVVQTFFGANLGSFTAIGQFTAAIVGPGAVVALVEASALTGGAATLWAEIWGS